jgi:uncharacterized protein YjbI with pentapeptide repeats
MANPEHLAILKQGVSVWNEWHEARRGVSPDLSHADLQRATLDGANLGRANLTFADLSGASLKDGNLAHADLSGANLKDGNLEQADLSSARLRNADFSMAYLYGADFIEANLEGAHLVEANLSSANLRRVNLRGARLRRANLSNANLNGADLTLGVVAGATVVRANLMAACLGVADLRGADLTGADLTASDLSHANFTGASLRGAQLSQATLNSTSIVNCDLRGVEGLEAVKHDGPSYVSIDTIYKSEGQIPESFLLGCGVPDSFIAQIPALIGALQPIQFYSCFISYSTEDEGFARRLHQRMRAEKLRVWFAPEDVQGGKKLHEQIERAIQVHDRLLLVLSEDSIHSEWVMTEIRNARKVEVKDGRRKLFPIRLCSYEALGDWKCFDGDTGKDLAAEVSEYFIPDFSNWKNHDGFEAAFAKLLRDLRASEL